MTKTKAQKIRYNRLNSICNLNEQAKEIFDWILDLIDEDTKRGIFESITVCLHSDSCKIERFKKLKGNAIEYFGQSYNLPDSISKHKRIQLFETLEEVVKSEDGFHIVCKNDDKLGIVCEIVIY